MIPIAALLRVAASKVASTANALKTAVKTTVSDIGRSVKSAAQKAIKPIVSRETIKNVSGEKAKPKIDEALKPDYLTESKNQIVSRETFDDLIKDTSDNETFRFLINNAGDPTLSPYDSSDVSLFFSLTKYIWDKPEISLDQRLDAIADYFKRPLIDIFEYIIKSDEAIEFLEDYILGDIAYEKYAFAPYSVAGYQVSNSSI